jgi:soluble lytic murein transglycosylase
MKRAAVAVVALIVLGPKGGHYLLAEGGPEVRAEDSATLAPVVLKTTDHPPIPRELSQFWMAPDSRRPRTAAQANLATAVKFENEGNHAKALSLLTNPATKQDGPLAAYAEFYKGLAQLRLGRAADARATFQQLQETKPVGYLSEMAALREAECDEQLGDQPAALAVYERLSATRTLAPDEILMKIGKTAQALGDTQKAQDAFERVYYEFPLSDLTDDAASHLPDVGVSTGSIRFSQELARAERLFAARQYPAARTSYEKLRSASQGEDRTAVLLRLAETDYFLHKYRASADALKPFVSSGTRPAEALYYYALAQRELKSNPLFHDLMRRVVTEFPDTSWAEDALNSLALADAHDDEDEAADQESAELFEKFPKGRYTERAAWRIGWRAYRRGQYADAVRIFERAAFNFPRSDYRPAWLYWSGRAHEGLSEPDLAESRYSIEVIDYKNTYHGRLASARLGGRIPDRATLVAAAALTSDSTNDDLPQTLPPNADLVRALLTAKMYDAAADELRYAQKIYGDSGAIQATFAWTYRQQGQSETGSQQLSLYRGSINAMKRAYPQYLTAGGERLPREILRIIYPVAYWDLIQKYSAPNGLDPFLVAALMCQESTFVANIRSPAKAVGLMQLVAPTARQYAKRLGIPYSSAVLTTPELNIRIATAYLGDQLREFGSWYRVLAAYNAGDGRVRRWVTEREGLSQEEWIDDIPFFETQAYVRKLLANAEDYRRLYGTDAGLAADDEIPSTTKTAEASDVDPTLSVKKKAATAKPAAPTSQSPVRAKKKKRTAA